MSSRHNLARHRAQTVRMNPLDSVSKAVSVNAGTVGRQAAVIAAASGLILSIGMPANAADANIGVSASAESGSQATQLAVTAAPTATVSFERPAVTTEAAPVIETIAPQSSDDTASPEAAVETIAAKAGKLVDAARSGATSGVGGALHSRLEALSQLLQLGRNDGEAVGVLLAFAGPIIPVSYTHLTLPTN